VFIILPQRPPRRETRARGVPTLAAGPARSRATHRHAREADMRRSAHAGLIAVASFTLTFAVAALADDFTANPGGHWK